MKKTLGLFILGVLSASAMAADNFTGWSLGGELGTTKYSISGKDIDGSIKSDNTKNLNLTGSYGFAYGQTNWVGGVELKVNPIKSTLKEGNGFKHEQKAQWGLNYIQGYRATDDLMPYVRVGYNAAQMKSKGKVGSLSLDKSYTANGIGYGLGAKYAFTPNIEANVEYARSHLKFSDHADDLTFKGNSVNAGISYRFR